MRLTGQRAGPVAVTGSGTELNRAITNLVANAIRHTPSGDTVRVQLASLAGFAQLTVRDECGGIPADDLERVFDVGFRGEPARPQASGGAGLGLAITRGIVEAYDGSVDVINVTDGCLFTVHLPLSEPC